MAPSSAGQLVRKLTQRLLVAAGSGFLDLLANFAAAPFDGGLAPATVHNGGGVFADDHPFGFAKLLDGHVFQPVAESLAPSPPRTAGRRGS
jgi:hypothetical protein